MLLMITLMPGYPERIRIVLIMYYLTFYARFTEKNKNNIDYDILLFIVSFQVLVNKG